MTLRVRLLEDWVGIRLIRALPRTLLAELNSALATAVALAVLFTVFPLGGFRFTGVFLTLRATFIFVSSSDHFSLEKVQV
ncbi:MAG: hypothetical protein HY644_02100 [Acidobacteria bacterium]|nr:hypothetical protein [Acidobacteriota bacterium]